MQKRQKARLIKITKMRNQDTDLLCFTDFIDQECVIIKMIPEHKNKSLKALRFQCFQAYVVHLMFDFELNQKYVGQ